MQNIRIDTIDQSQLHKIAKCVRRPTTLIKKIDYVSVSSNVEPNCPGTRQLFHGTSLVKGMHAIITRESVRHHVPTDFSNSCCSVCST